MLNNLLKNYIMIISRIGDKMFNRKFSSNIRRKKRMMISTIILLVVLLSVGYAAFTTNLSINGTLGVTGYNQTLYTVLKKAANQGYAREYTGSHQDTMAGVGSEKIYYWYADNDTNGTTITDMNNVIFANHCWQMIRTTDTGGVKMIYNGEPENNQCLNTRGNHIGYGARTTTTLSTSHYYGTSYSYNKSTGMFSLDGTITTGTIQTGQYTCELYSATGSCVTLHLVDKQSSGSTYYVIPIINNSHYSQFGTLQFSQSDDSPAYAGYMYNTVYPLNSKYYYNFYVTLTNSWTINASYYYSDTIDYGNQNAGQYTLTNPNYISGLSDYNSLVGKFILPTSGTNATTARYVTAVNGNNVYYRELTDGDVETSLTVGDSYTKNGNTYTLTNPTNVSYINWLSHTSDYSIYKGKYVCDGNNTSCTNLKHIYTGSDPTSNYYCYFDTSNEYSYSESVNYSGGTYTLTGDIKTFWDLFDSTNQDYLPTHHYTCLENGISCATVNYVNYYDYGVLYYAQLTNVTDVSTALTNMLSSDNVNLINSTIKTGVDAWYKKYMTSYTSQLEDTIFCYDRSIKSIGAWDPNGGSVTSMLYFKNIDSNKDLSCTNITDKFSIANPKATLTYPVGLITIPETRLFSNKNIRKTGQQYWISSPTYVSSSSPALLYVTSTAGFSNVSVGGTYGVRPVISLKPGTEYESGTGSMADPYVVEAGESLYNVLKDAADEGTYAKKYTGNHHDSFSLEPSHDIYYWWANSDTNGTAIQNKNNVIFANKCWKMIRTTDTGGVKMILYGSVNSGKCNSPGSTPSALYSAFNGSRSLAYVGYMYNSDTAITSISDTYTSGSKFGTGVTYSNGTYTLTSTTTSLNSTHHYTCNNTSGTCSTVRYYHSDGKYIELSGGKTIDQAITDMLSADNVNQTNSTAKTAIDSWYETYLASYSSKLEDTIFCNNRTITSLGGWNPNGGDISESLKFNNYDTGTDLSCNNITDKFSMANSKAQLTYPIGLLTTQEVNLLNNKKIKALADTYWLMTPCVFVSYQADIELVYNSGNINSASASTGYNLHPVISLKPGIKYVSGEGTTTNPYVIQ